jgi:Flp pilus assembly pilin Flp
MHGAQMIRRWLGDRSGATAIEYALIAAITGITCAGAIAQMGNSTDGMWGRVKTAFLTYMN